MSHRIMNVKECAKDNGSYFLVCLNHDLPTFRENNECNLIQHLCREVTQNTFKVNIKMPNYAIRIRT